MAQALMSRWRWQLLQARDAAGGAGLLALLAVAALLALLTFWWQPLKAREERLVRELAAQAQRRAQPMPEARPAPGPADELSAYRQRFPTLRQTAPVLAKIHALAQRQGLALPQAEFRLNPGADDELARYTIALPVKGDYRRLRSFVEQLLKEVPAIALQEIAMRRDDARSGQLDARLQLVLFVNTGE